MDECDGVVRGTDAYAFSKIIDSEMNSAIPGATKSGEPY